MIEFESFSLDNGLRVIFHQDTTSPMAVLNLMYDVGSRDEQPDKTGFAHLFEHLMFGGSKNVPVFDEPLQRVGGENNAFTNNDITNYYVTLPADNIETACWLESDRMLELNFSSKSLEVQQNVVIEEFNQRYLNQPYGTAMHELRKLAYTVHPYSWPTIGATPQHVSDATLEDVKSFFYKYYRPNNAILVIGGNLEFSQAKDVVQKWFGSIPKGNTPERILPIEPRQTVGRFAETSSNVPLDAIYKAYHMPARFHQDFYTADLISDILGRGKSSRLHERLVDDLQIFQSVNAYPTGSFDPGLFLIEGKVNYGIAIEEAEKRLNEVISSFLDNLPSERELTKVKNQAESTLLFGEVELLNRAINLAFFTLGGDTNAANLETQKIQQIAVGDIQRVASNVLNPENCSTLYFRKTEAG